MAVKWTEEALRAEAAKYASKVEFERGRAGAYNAARRLGLIDELFGKNVRWNEGALRAEASKYASKVEFMRGSNGAYQTTLKKFPGLLDEMFENQYRSWNKEAIRKEAAKYSSKKEFSQGSNGAYQTTLKRFPGLIDEMFENQPRASRKWNEDTLRAEAAKYSSKIEFKRGNNGAHIAILTRFPGLIDELFGKNFRWTEEALRAEAAKYSTKVDFQRGHNGAYNTALTRFPGLLDELFEDKRWSWTERAIRAEAAKYSSKSEFERGSSGAYGAANTRFPGLLDEMFENKYRYTTADVFYIWRTNVRRGKKIVVKIGITSARLGAERIRQCARANNLQVEEMHLFKTGEGNAKAVEALLHTSYKIIPDGFTDGKTEFRTVSEKSMRDMVDIIAQFGERLAA